MSAHLRDHLTSLGIPEDQQALALDGWEVSTATRDGKDCAVVLTKGTEIHFVSLGGPAMTRKNTLEYLTPIFAEWNFVSTRTPIAETDDRLRHMLGFKFQWSDAQYKYWTLFALPFSKKAKP